jgi:hypothetical protein
MAFRRNARIVDEHMQPAEGAHRLGGHFFPSLFARHIMGHERSKVTGILDFVGKRLACRLVHIRAHDFGAFAGQKFSRCRADAFCRARHNGDLAAQPSHRKLPVIACCFAASCRRKEAMASP